MKLDAKTIMFGTLVLYLASLAVCLTGKTVEVPERFTHKTFARGDLILMRSHQRFISLARKIACDRLRRAAACVSVFSEFTRWTRCPVLDNRDSINGW